MLSDILEDYQEADVNQKKELLDEFINSVWKSKCRYSTYKKIYTYDVNDELLDDRQDLIELFNKHRIIELDFCKSFYKKKLTSADYIRVHINNMFGYLTDKNVYLSKQYYEMVMTPRNLYYIVVNKLKNKEEVNYNEIRHKIDYALEKAPTIKKIDQEKKIKLTWKEYKKLINTYIERLFNNYTPPHEYEKEHGWEMRVSVNGWSDDNFAVKYFNKSLTGYMRNYVKNKLQKSTSHICVTCRKPIEKNSNSQKYCSNCSINAKEKQKNNWRDNIINMNKKEKISKVGETSKNKNGSSMKIVSYTSYSSVDIEFDDGYKTTTNYGNFIKGAVRNPNDKVYFGIGFLGVGKYKASINRVPTKHYSTWRSMLERCYSEKYHKRQPTYKECFVCEEWLNFQNFAEWFECNYYELDDETVCLDKDILTKRNKLYSPNTCIFVPKSINSLFVKNNVNRGDLPIGVVYRESEKKYYAYISNGNNKKLHIGTYDNPDTAFANYKKSKENLIREKAYQYKNLIPNKLYEALLSYKVHIDD